ncbi:MAG: nucleoside-diphosphate sugar epimerase/dehydratase [bacterium]
MRKNGSPIFLLITDIVLISIALMLAFLIRSEWTTGFYFQYAKILPFAIFIRLAMFRFFGLYQGIWRYTGVTEFFSVFKAVSLGSGIIITLTLFLEKNTGYFLSLLTIDWMLDIGFISGSRFMPRLMAQFRKSSYIPRAKVLIIGAGDAGEMVAKEIIKHPELAYKVVGFIDDDPQKLGKYIHNFKVLGARDDIVDIARRELIDKVIIAIPSAPGQVIRDIVAHCEKIKVKFEIVPGVYEIITGDVSINQIREVKPEDLLGRETVHLDLAEISSYIWGKRVLVTGAGGSIGGELCRQIARFTPSQLILLDHNENGVYYVKMDLNKESPLLNSVTLIADIKDKARINDIFAEYRPETVFHAAAHKHVPMMEMNPVEAVKNNVGGTKNLMEAAIRCGTERFLLISTDKAVNPTSIMGASKRVAELLMQLYTMDSATSFAAVRFGNVLGSEGSVVPLFKRQIAEKGPVTVTHPDAARYFMTIPEAVSLIIQALNLGGEGEIFLLDMGQPIRIVDLARDLITLSGFEPDREIKIEFTGLRPGEKLFEELLTATERTTATKYQRIFKATPDRVDRVLLKRDIQELIELAEQGEAKKTIAKLKEIVPNYQPRRQKLPAESSRL